MTWSIIARDPENGWLGIAVASRFFAVGALVPHLRRDAAVATQAFVNPLWGIEGLAALSSGLPAADALAALVARDPGQAQRQAHMIDTQGRSARHTGEACVPWAGHLSGENVSLAGNMLAGPQVLDATLEAWLAGATLPMPARLLAAMQAGESAGGDKRGRQAAGLRVHRGEDYPWIDIRADDNAAPLDELERLLAVSEERYVHFAENMGTRARFEGVTDRAPFDARMARLEAERAAAGWTAPTHATTR
ncbi:MAG: DUF1028 domain-containing protein [Pseudomonadota bacterium]